MAGLAQAEAQGGAPLHPTLPGSDTANPGSSSQHGHAVPTTSAVPTRNDEQMPVSNVPEAPANYHIAPSNPAPNPQGFPHQPHHPQFFAKGDNAQAFDLEAGQKPKTSRQTRYERRMERQAQKQGPWGEGKKGIHVLLWLIPISGALGFAFVLPWLHPWALRLTFYIIAAVCLALAMVCLYFVNQLDPGVVPPQPTKDAEVAAAEAGQATRLRMDGRAQWVRPPAGYSGPLDAGTKIRGWERYCSTCNIWRGPRVTHCGICGYCMQRFDHHCAVLGTCIAQNNQRFFVTFLLSVGIGSGIMFAGSIILLVQRHWKGAHAWSDWHTYFGLLLTLYFSYLALLLVFGCCHVVLLLCDLTSKQMAQRRIDEAFGSFASCLMNLVRVCCAPIHHKRSVPAPYSIGPPPAYNMTAPASGQPYPPHKTPVVRNEHQKFDDEWKAHQLEGQIAGGHKGGVWQNAETHRIRTEGESIVASQRRAPTDGADVTGSVDPQLDGSDDHVVKGRVDPEARAGAEERLQEQENRSVEQVAHLGPLFPGM